MDLRTAIDEFIEDRESYGRKPKTLRFYHTHLGGMADFLEICEISDVCGLTRASVRKFFVHLQRRDLAQDTVAAYDRAVRAFCAFCVAEEWLDKDPMIGRPRLKSAEKLPDTFSDEEIRKLLATCATRCQVDVRDAVIMLVMLDTGLRAGEVCAMAPAWLEFCGTRGKIHVPASDTKSARARTCPLSEETVPALKFWMRMRLDAKTVFTSIKGSRMTSSALTPGGLNQMMHRRCRTAGIEGKTRLCHIWRHTFAKKYVLGGGDLESLRRLLGHQSLETVRIYLRFRTEDLERQHSRFSPVSQIFGT